MMTVLSISGKTGNNFNIKVWRKFFRPLPERRRFSSFQEEKIPLCRCFSKKYFIKKEDCLYEDKKDYCSALAAAMILGTMSMTVSADTVDVWDGTADVS